MTTYTTRTGTYRRIGELVPVRILICFAAPLGRQGV